MEKIIEICNAFSIYCSCWIFSHNLKKSILIAI